MTVDTSAHRRTWDQIPWILNGTLPSEELQAATQHLHGCSDCREEFEFQRHIAQALNTGDAPEADPHRSWEQLRSRIESQSSATAVRGPTHPRWTNWLVAAMVVQAVGLGVLGAALWSRSSAPAAEPAAVYRTLSAAEPAGVAAPTIRVVFAADMSVSQMQTLLNQSGLQVVSGPSSAGVWSLGPGGDARHTATQAALQQLRNNPAVRFAEAIGAGAP